MPFWMDSGVIEPNKKLFLLGFPDSDTPHFESKEQNQLNNLMAEIQRMFNSMIKSDESES